MQSVIKKAFTLIELLVVIAIIGILSGLIVVTMSGVTQKANIAKAQVFSNSLRNALMLDLISEWKLDGNTNDDWGIINGIWHGSGGGTNLTANYRPASECVFGQCLNFDGTDDYVNFGSWDLVGTPITASVWINPSTSPSLMSDKRFFSANYHDVRFNAGILEVRIYDTAFRYLTCPATNFSANTWYNIVISSTSNDMRLYVNGALCDTSDILTLIAHPYNLNIGANYAGDNRFFSGMMDDVRIYGAAVPVSEIREQYYIGLNSMLLNGVISEQDYASRMLDFNYGYAKR
ncbi:MAG: prepilin-type N-terminal cleavage/methylation domain-containing protein [Candidatus Pacebacteria bacterium]|nr:prepilin-type N-terminal cleavage/methylation domain-containing protein [Candidatus Paceibacterota bacterium]